MALPNQLRSARMTDATAANLIDNNVADLEVAIADIFGVPINTPINAGFVLPFPLQLQLANDSAVTWGGTANGILGNASSAHVAIKTASTERVRFNANGLVLSGDENTYIAHPADDSISVVAGGAEKVRVTSNGLVFGADLDTYISLTGTNELTVTAGGVASLIIDDAGVIIAQNTLVLANDIDTFLARTAEDVLQLYTGGSPRLRVDNDKVDVIGGRLVLAGDSDTYFEWATTNQLRIIAGGTEIVRFSTAVDIKSGGLVFNGDMDTFISRPAADTLAWTTGGTEWMRLTSDGVLLLGTTSTNPSFQDRGMLVHLGSSAGEAIALQHSSLTHGMTALASAQTFANFRMAQSSPDGGLRINSFTEGNRALILSGQATTTDTTDTTSSVATVMITGSKQSGTSSAGLSGTENAVVLQSGNVTRFLMKGDGSIHASDTGGFDALDAYDDVALVRALELERPAGVIRSQWDDFVSYNKETLIEAGILGRDGPDGSKGLLNISQLLRLHNGALWQLQTQIMDLKHSMTSSSGLLGSWWSKTRSLRKSFSLLKNR